MSVMPTATWSRLLSLARPEARSLIIGTAALTVGSAIALSYPLVVRQLIDGITPGGGTDAVDSAVIALLVLFAIGAALGAVRSWYFTVAGERVVARLRKDLYASLIRQEVGFFDKRRTGELTNRLSADTTVLQNTVTVNISMGLRFTILSLGAVAFLFYTSWKLTLVTLLLVPVVAIAAGLTGRRLRKLSLNVQDALAASTAHAEETLAGVRTVRAFAAEEQESARYDEVVEASFQIAKRRATAVAAFRGVIGFAGYATIAVVHWYGGHLLADGSMTIGALTSYLLYTLTVAFSLGAVSGLYEDFMKALGASERVFELLDRVPALSSGSKTLTSPDGAVSLDNVTFAYPTRPGVNVLQGVSLNLRPGEQVALVGPSGGGKSTVAALLSRFYDPAEGQIRLDGVPLVDLDADWLRRQVGVVSQEPVLFATSISDNIAYGAPGMSQDQIEGAARMANAHDFISALPDGYDTPVGERGVRLSGGQKQRVAIARALLKDPTILTLDEATSALDAESEHLVQEALARLMEGRTTLVIAHRLSTVRDADRVIVVDKGRVVETGTHDTLIEAEGLYHKLVERQFAA